MSVVTYVVTPSIRLDGMNAQASQRRYLAIVTGLASGSLGVLDSSTIGRDLHSMTAQRPISRISRKYPLRHKRPCSARVNDGSSTRG